MPGSITVPHYLRFAMALTGASVTLGCGARVIDVPTTDGGSLGDTASIDTLVPTPPPEGLCVHSGGVATAGLACAAGQTCNYVHTTSTVVCTEASPSESYVACGAIRCATSWCYCVDSAKSTCGCSGAVEGPLPPPDLPMV